MSAHVANSSSHSRTFRSASHRAFAFGERARPRAAAATQSAARSSGGVPDVAYLMRPRRRPQPVFLLPRDSALRAPPSASRSSRAAGRPISLHKNTAPPRAEFGKFILPLLWLLPAGRFPCLARFRGATLPGLLGPLQASPRGRMTRRIGRIRGERGNIHFPAPTTALQAARHQPRQRARQAIAQGARARRVPALEVLPHRQWYLLRQRQARRFGRFAL